MSEIPDFYKNQASTIENAEIIRNMQSKYQRFLDNYLQKSFDEWVDRWLLELVKANWDNINFRVFIDYLLNTQADLLDADDVYQLAALRNEVINLREEIEQLWARDFEIIQWNIWSYSFMWNDSFKYLWRNFYEVNIDFSKIKTKEVRSWLNIERQYNRWEKFYIEYDWNNVIKYYSGRNFNNKRLLWHEVISHKFEIERRWNTVYRKWAEQDLYLSRLWMNLRIKFFEKRER